MNLHTYLVKSWKWLLYRIYGFERWHISSLDQRAYARDIIRYANNRVERKSCLEIGCGLGDIIRNLHYSTRQGYDIDEKVLGAARLLNRFTAGGSIHYELFTFPENELRGQFNLLIMVNWIHHIDPETLKNKIQLYLAVNIYPGGEIIIDTVKDPEYRYNHDIEFLTTGLPVSVQKIGTYPRQREIWAIKKI